MFSIITSSPEQTWQAGKALGKLLDAGDTVCLYGDLGAGKTNFAFGVALGLAVQEQYITSPTFTFVNMYEGRVPLYHIDLYRLKDPEELESIGFNDYIESDGVALIEWAERADDELPNECLSVYLSQVDEQGREIGFLAEGDRYTMIIEQLKQEINAAPFSSL